jgi:hypothetical protein
MELVPDFALLHHKAVCLSSGCVTFKMGEQGFMTARFGVEDEIPATNNISADSCILPLVKKPFLKGLKAPGTVERSLRYDHLPD